MQTANERLELLKWASVNIKKVERLQKVVDKLCDKVTSEAIFQDINLVGALNGLRHLGDRLEYLDKEIDSQHFVNEGVLKMKDK